LAKTFSRIAKALKVSKHGHHPLGHIVQIVREHFLAEVCSLFEIRNGILKMVASDGNYPSSGMKKPDYPENLSEITCAGKKAVFNHDSGVIPLLYHEKIVGVFTIRKKEAEGFTLPERDFLGFIGIQLAGAVRTLTITKQAKHQLRKNSATFSIQGIPVSSGFGIGPAFFLHSGITTKGFSKLDSSLQSKKEEGVKLREAFQKTSSDLSQLMKKFETKFSGEELGIFNSHKAILADPDLLKKMELEIQIGKSALEAVGGVFQTFMLQFGNRRIPGFDKTSVDLEELKQRLFENLLGMDSRRDKENWEGILVAKSLGPSDTIRLDPGKLLGIVTMTGGPNSHAAILARSLDIPAVMRFLKKNGSWSDSLAKRPNSPWEIFYPIKYIIHR
jgi:signal transduction protein with GAF and PtsI domain